jgi:hypothetical protein
MSFRCKIAKEKYEFEGAEIEFDSKQYIYSKHLEKFPVKFSKLKLIFQIRNYEILAFYSIKKIQFSINFILENKIIKIKLN